MVELERLLESLTGSASTWHVFQLRLGWVFIESLHTKFYLKSARKSRIMADFVRTSLDRAPLNLAGNEGKGNKPPFLPDLRFP